AIMTFSSHVNVVQDYTTDKSVLSAAIDTLPLGGETALYQGAYEAIQRAAASPTPRRAVILLSDGAEYGGISHVGREAAGDEALKAGVPVYSIGVGFGFDRTYLEGLSSSTNAQTYESPTSTELTQIYTDLAAKLRSQYVVTLNVPLPLDGTQYNLGLAVKTSEGSADATAVLRSPIPVPVVRLPDLSDPIAQPTDITATVLHDDPLQSVTLQVNGRPAFSASAEPYSLTINPVDYVPGSYILTATATDANGDIGTGTLNFTVAALPSEISLSPELTDQSSIAEPQTFTVETSGQTATTAVSVAFNGAAPTDLDAPYNFTIDPIFFMPGSYTVTVSVTNAGGVTATKEFPFSIPILPPKITIIGLQDGQSISTPVKFTVDATGQEPVSEISATAGSVDLVRDSDGAFTIDPMMFPPGATALTVTATQANGNAGTAQLNFIVAPLSPQIIVHGLTAGETLSADRKVTLDFVTQTPVIHVAFFVDGQDLAHEIHPPYGITIGVLDYTPGDHNLRMIADDADGQSSTLDLPFTIAPEPAVSATAYALVATQGAVATATQQVVQTAAAIQATQVAQAAQATGTQIANASQTAVAAIMATQIAQATQAEEATGTQIANASQTAAALMAVNATATQIAQATETQIANASQTAAAQIALQATASAGAAQATQTAQATATLQAQMTETQQQVILMATGNARSTQEIASGQATGTAAAQDTANGLSTQAALQQQATTNGLSTQMVLQQQATATSAVIIQAMLATQSVQQANATATSAAVATQAVQATQNAQASATKIAQATETSAVIIQAMLATQSAQQANATATSAAVATQAAQATQNAQATTMQAAQAVATQAAQATQNAQATIRAMAVAQAQAATRDSLSTANAQARLSAQATENARATRNAAATVTEQANATATVLKATDAAAIAATVTSAAQQTQAIVATATAAVQQTQAVAATTTAEAQQTLDALEATATQVILNATATRHALETEAADNSTATQVVSNATAAAITQATGSAQETLVVVATANRAAQLTMTAQQIVNDMTATAVANGVATLNAGATATSDAQATIDTRQTAVGPTATPLDAGAQNALTPQATPTLTEIQAQEPAASADVAPIAIVVIVIIVLIVVLVLIMRGRGAPKR
ncbi:MAG: hypothetical protein ABI700_07280, partial [Chloroflexota bacterium]